MLFRRSLSQPIVMATAYTYITILAIVFSYLGYYSNNSFFHWGTPVTFFNHKITSTSHFYTIHLIIFLHQLINNWVNSVVYPWILNDVQDPKNLRMKYGKCASLLMINFFNIYSEFDTVVILMGFTSQISFIVTVNVANIIASTYLNNAHINRKTQKEDTPLVTTPTVSLGDTPMVRCSSETYPLSDGTYVSYHDIV